jgi:hypothetical protein
MASLNGPIFSRTCVIGKGLTFHALFSRLSRRSSRWAFSDRVGCGAAPKSELGRSAPPATVAAVDTNCLRVIAPPDLIRNSSPESAFKAAQWAVFWPHFGFDLGSFALKNQFVFGF